MAKKITAEVSLGFAYSPLSISGGIEVVGNVPASQQYDIATGLFTPDYTSTFLRLRPWIEIADPDGVLTEAEKKLTNISWFVTQQGSDTQVTAGTDYAIGTDGTLSVRRNITPDYPATFRCEAEFLDSRTGEVHGFVKTLQVMSESVSVPPRLVIDAPRALFHDPLRDSNPVRKIKARLLLGDSDVPVANREFVWQKKDEQDTAYSEIDGSDIMDYDVSLSADGTELTIDTSLIGKRIDIRVFAKYNPFGSAASVAIDTRTPVAEFTVTRYEPTVSAEILCARRFYPGLGYLKPECVVSDSKGILPNVDSLVDINWYTAKGNVNGTVSKGAVIATGSRPTIPTSSVVKRYGGRLIAECSVKEPLKAAVVGGDVLTVNGQVILIR